MTSKLLVYAVRRLTVFLPTALGVMTIAFIIARIIPGDPAQALLGERATAEALAILREQIGLNKPIHIQYVEYIYGLVRGDLGRSFFAGRPIFTLITERFPATLELTLTGLILAVPLAIFLGTTSALHRKRPVDHYTRILSLVGVSMPVFWFALLLQLFFGVGLGSLPVSGRADPRIEHVRITGFQVLDDVLTLNIGGLQDTLAHLVMPALALAVVPLSEISRITRASMLEVLDQDYVYTARSKGLRERTVIYIHALRNALVPITTVVGIRIGWMLGGAVLVETVFSWPGMGRLIFDSIIAREYMVVQGAVVVYALTFLTVNLLVDILYAYIDPRIKY